MAAHRAGDVQVTIARASDYFGPEAAEPLVGERFFRPILGGRAVQAIGDPDAPHSVTYVPDFARALVELARHDSAFGEAWRAPTAPAVSIRRFAELVGAAAGTGTPRLTRVPGPMLRLVGEFVPPVREVYEMLYEFEDPYVADGPRIERPSASPRRPSRSRSRRPSPGGDRTWPRRSVGWPDGSVRAARSAVRHPAPGPAPGLAPPVGGPAPGPRPPPVGGPAPAPGPAPPVGGTRTPAPGHPRSAANPGTPGRRHPAWHPRSAVRHPAPGHPRSAVRHPAPGPAPPVGGTRILAGCMPGAAIRPVPVEGSTRRPRFVPL